MKRGRRILKYHLHRAACREHLFPGKTAKIHPAIEHDSSIWREKLHQDTDERRLPRTARPRDPQRLSFRKREGNILQHLLLHFPYISSREGFRNMLYV
ncbi:Uncharacterised protein [Bacteroides xylanisolvens]|nr:Uncharacterised protein [Bacteroides xylanisolvens]